MPRRKRKNWYRLIAPEWLGEKEIGQTLASDPDKVKSRTIEVSLPTIKETTSKYSYKLFFKVTKVEEDKAHCSYQGHQCLRDYLMRLVRKGSDRLDVRVVERTKDGKELLAKIIAITLSKTTGAIKSALSKRLKSAASEAIKKRKLKDFIKAMIDEKIQKSLKESCKLYPLQKIEVRRTKVL